MRIGDHVRIFQVEYAITTVMNSGSRTKSTGAPFGKQASTTVLPAPATFNWNERIDGHLGDPRIPDCTWARSTHDRGLEGLPFPGRPTTPDSAPFFGGGRGTASEGAKRIDIAAGAIFR